MTLDERVAKIIDIATRMPASSAAPLIRAGILQVIEEECEQCALDVDVTVTDHDEDTPGGWCAANAARHAAKVIRRRNLKIREP